MRIDDALHGCHPDVHAYCASHGLSEAIETACALAHSSLHLHGDITLTLETDPELNEQNITIRFAVQGSQEQILDARRHFIRQLVTQIPQESCAHLRIAVRVV
jgi:hypothetical protein